MKYEAYSVELLKAVVTQWTSVRCFAFTKGWNKQFQRKLKKHGTRSTLKRKGKEKKTEYRGSWNFSVACMSTCDYNLFSFHVSIIVIRNQCLHNLFGSGWQIASKSTWEKLGSTFIVFRALWTANWWMRVAVFVLNSCSGIVITSSSEPLLGNYRFTGSWLTTSLHQYFTPEFFNRTCASSVKDFMVICSPPNVCWLTPPLVLFGS